MLLLFFENGKQAGNSLGTVGKWKNLGKYVHKIFMGMRMKRKNVLKHKDATAH